MRTLIFGGLLGLLLALVLVGGSIYINSNSALLDPLELTSAVDLAPLLKARIVSPLTLSSVADKTLTSLDSIPRYLSFEPNTGQVFAARNATTSFSPASFTKLLSAQVALDLVPLPQNLRVFREATLKEPTILGIKMGEQFTLAELLRASIATSANDAATNIGLASIALYGQTGDQFLVAMNQKAQLLGMTSSNFASFDGLDMPNQQTTMVDLVKLVRNTISLYPEIISATASDRQDIEKNQFHSRYYISNWNGLLKIYPGVYGLKIAYTGQAGYGTIVVSKREGKQVVAIVSGADSIPERDLAAAALLDAGFIAQGVSPARITRDKLRPRYQEWTDLINQTKRELEAIEKNKQNQ